MHRTDLTPQFEQTTVVNVQCFANNSATKPSL